VTVIFAMESTLLLVFGIKVFLEGCGKQRHDQDYVSWKSIVVNCIHDSHSLHKFASGIPPAHPSRAVSASTHQNSLQTPLRAPGWCRHLLMQCYHAMLPLSTVMAKSGSWNCTGASHRHTTPKVQTHSLKLCSNVLTCTPSATTPATANSAFTSGCQFRTWSMTHTHVSQHSHTLDCMCKLVTWITRWHATV
jgi:hypothetical protein